MKAVGVVSGGAAARAVARAPCVVVVLAALASLVSPAESSLPAAKVATAKPPPGRTVPPTPLPPLPRTKYNCFELDWPTAPKMPGGQAPAAQANGEQVCVQRHCGSGSAWKGGKSYQGAIALCAQQGARQPTA